MVIQLRPYLFQSAATIYQECPRSPLFNLPALANPDVRTWMKDIFPVELKKLEDNASNPVDLARVQNEVLRQALERMNDTIQRQSVELSKLHEILDRRTAVMSPTKGFSLETHHERGMYTMPIFSCILILSMLLQLSILQVHCELLQGRRTISIKLKTTLFELLLIQRLLV